MTDTLSIYDIADVMREHKKEILKEARRSAKHGYRVMAEIENDGTWRGVGVVTPGTGSLLAHEGRGFACFFSCDSFMSYNEIEEQIWQWTEEKQQIYDAWDQAERDGRER